MENRYTFDCDCINDKIRDKETGRTLSVYDRSLYHIYGQQPIDSLNQIIKELNEGKLSFDSVYERGVELRRNWKR
jgi:hypothetical protein